MAQVHDRRMKPIQFDLNASFSSMVSRARGIEGSLTTEVGTSHIDMSGPQQPAMTPTQTVELGSEKKSAKPDDPNWNSRSEDAGAYKLDPSRGLPVTDD